MQQLPIDVIFEGEKVGEYFADLAADKKIIIELKATQAISTSHEAQLLNYLKATKYEVGLFLNFGPKPEFRRRVFTNQPH